MIQPLNIIIFIFIIGVFLVIVLCKCLDLYERFNVITFTGDVFYIIISAVTVFFLIYYKIVYY